MGLGGASYIGLGLQSRTLDWDVTKAESGGQTFNGLDYSTSVESTAVGINSGFSIPGVSFLKRTRFEFLMAGVSSDELKMRLPGAATESTFSDGVGIDFGMGVGVDLGMSLSAGEIGGFVGLGLSLTFIGYDGSEDNIFSKAGYARVQLPLPIGAYYQYEMATFTLRTELGIDIGADSAVVGTSDEGSDSGVAYTLEPENAVNLFLNVSAKFTPIAVALGLDFGRVAGLRLMVAFAF